MDFLPDDAKSILPNVYTCRMGRLKTSTNQPTIDSTLFKSPKTWSFNFFNLGRNGAITGHGGKSTAFFKKLWKILELGLVLHPRHERVTYLLNGKRNWKGSALVFFETLTSVHHVCVCCPSQCYHALSGAQKFSIHPPRWSATSQCDMIKMMIMMMIIIMMIVLVLVVAIAMITGTVTLLVMATIMMVMVSLATHIHDPHNKFSTLLPPTTQPPSNSWNINFVPSTCSRSRWWKEVVVGGGHTWWSAMVVGSECRRWS